MNPYFILFYAISSLLIVVGTFTLAYFPIALYAALKPRPPAVFGSDNPLVSIIVPAYNEGKVIGHCVESILESNYQNFEVILVDDGSKDDTLEVMRRYQGNPRVQVYSKPNGGKASALNEGFERSKGEILFFVDADGIFTPGTIDEMLKAFTSPKVGAVCGNDAPVNLDRLQTRLMCLQTHVGTGFVRRALAELNCLPIVSGNLGAFRRSVLDQVGIVKADPFVAVLTEAWEINRGGPFRDGFIGEDLELTWRVHRAGFQVKFAPKAIVLAEVPSTIKSLWKQRVRWARGLLQTIRLHRDMFFNLKYGTLGLYLPINFFNMIVVPFLQLLVFVLLISLMLAGYRPITLNLVGILLWLGIGAALLSTLFAVALDWSWKDLRYFYVIPLWVPYALMMDLVMVWAIILEIFKKESQWNKLERTGVVSRRS
jgi:poly-beta-1,6-N-acetyl-D-glucosamine synthase